MTLLPVLIGLASGIGFFALFVVLSYSAPSFLSPQTSFPRVIGVQNEIVVNILPNAHIQSHPAYNPDFVDAIRGQKITWINRDSVIHTITSADDFGKSFDSDVIEPGKKFTLETSTITCSADEIGKYYRYYDRAYPIIHGTIRVACNQAGLSPHVSMIVISRNSSVSVSLGDFNPNMIRVVIGVNNTVRWINNDIAAHWIEADNDYDPDFASVTTFGTSGAGTRYSFLMPGEVFEYTFTKPGSIGYHGQPSERGSVVVLSNE